MNVNLTTLHPKETNLGECGIAFDHEEKALAFPAVSEGTALPCASLVRPRVEWMHARGFQISGFEEIKNQKYRYQEWWCEYLS